MKLRFAILAAICVATFAYIDTSAQNKQPPKKQVIPHAQDKPPNEPRSPQDAIKHMQVPPGFRVELVAAEPDIVNPVAMTFDERGRIWITESIEYPRRSAGPGKDRVKVLESTKGDGKFDKITTVIDGLNIPSGIAVGHGGVWVANSPDILFYPFEDFATPKLAKPQVVVTGFGRFDTHELPNSLTWGPDGWLYGLNGVFNRSVVKQDGKTFDFTCALFKIHPKTKKFELFCEGTSNPWGLAFNDNGDAFVSACVIDHLWHLTETGYYHRQGGPYPPYTWKIGSIVKHKHQKAAYCGLCWFDSDAYPPEYREKMYMGNIHGGCINVDALHKDGSTYFATPAFLPSPPVLRGRGAGGAGGEGDEPAFLPSPPVLRGRGAGGEGDEPAFLPSPPVLRGRGAGGEGDEHSTTSPSFNRLKTSLFAGSLTPSPLTPLPLSTGGEGNKSQPLPTSKQGVGNKSLGVGPGGDFLVANDAWFMPVAQKVGPDGCMYILDWYDRYHCYQDANRDPAGIDRLKGRLYRVVYKDYKAAGVLDVRKDSPGDLVGRMRSPNVFFRDVAQRIVAEKLMPLGEPSGGLPTLWRGSQLLRGGKEPRRTTEEENQIYGQLRTIVTSEKELLRTRLHALWSFGSFGVQDIEMAKLYKSKDPSIRMWMTRLFGYSYLTKDFVKDPSPDVQLQVAIAARKLKGVDPLPVLLDVLTHCGDDKLIPHIVWQNLHPLLEKDGERFLMLAAKVDLAKAPGVAKVLPRALDRILGNVKGDPAVVVKFLDKLDDASPTKQLCLTALTVKIQNNEVAGKQLEALRSQLKPGLTKMMSERKNAVAVDAAILLAAMRDKDGLAAAGQFFADKSMTESVRLKALAAQTSVQFADNLATVGRVLALKEGSADFRGQILSLLGKLADPQVGSLVLQSFAGMEPDLQPKAIELLTQRPSWAKALFKEVAAKKISKDAINVNQARRLLATKDKELVQLIEKHWGIPRTSRNPEREKLASQMRDLFTKSPGDPKAGAAVFAKVCAQCHKIYGQGVDVGPDLTSNGRSDFNQLLSNIFDPSLVIGAGYQAVTVNTKQGQLISGLLVEDNPERVVLKVQGGELKTIARKDVDERYTSKLSMMPEDLEKQLRPQEIVDLLSYLSLDRPPEDAKARRIPGTPR